MKKVLPVVLVRTWLSLARSNEAEDEVKSRALLMLRKNIGSPEQIHAYMKKHNIK